MSLHLPAFYLFVKWLKRAMACERWNFPFIESLPSIQPSILKMKTYKDIVPFFSRSVI